MRYIWQHIKTITESYDGKLPLAHYLKNYFRQYPKLGSRDRRILSAMAYSYYRCSKGIVQETFEETITACMQLCGNSTLLPSGTNVLRTELDVNALFPFDINLSNGIADKEWLKGMLTQPDLFIRIRRDQEAILRKITEAGIAYKKITEHCYALPNGAKIDSLLPPGTYVVQDASSQQTGNFFEPKKGEEWYDCCSGAGGKSLLLKDMEPSVALTVSDERKSIIHNLHERFKLYSHTLLATHVVNVADQKLLAETLKGKQFDNIICDVPCSGSGTWARTPEQMYFFSSETLAKFPPRQRAIAENVADHLKPGGRLIYITCSVFKAENEDVVEGLTNNGMELLSSRIINGISIHADSMYVAVLRKSQ